MNLTCPNCGTRFKIEAGALGTKGRKVKCGKCDHRWHAMPKSEAALAAAALAPDAAPAAPVSQPADPTEDFAPPPPPPPPPPPEPQAAPAAAPATTEAEDMADEFDNMDTGGMPDSMMDDPPPIPPESSFEPRAPRPAPKESSGAIKYWALLVLILVGGASAAFVFRDVVVHHFPPANMVFKMAGMPANTLGYGLKIYEPKTFLDINKKEKVLGITGQIMNETGKPIEIPLLKAILLGSKGENVKSWTFEAKQRRIDPGEKIKYETSLANPPSGATGLQITFTRAEEEMMDDKMKALDAK